ncbi:MAG: hypothetical protein BMS9Abin12_0146 [Acidimicrobiia bacterium]|nr:MAG: hypothetical protein BMS9Abin12_0146 [Acidimicrobiia bacterium]
MRRMILAAAVGLVLVLANPATAGEIAVSDLVSDGASFAGGEVTVVGELIGDYGRRRNGWTWTQLNGDSYAFAPVVDGGELSGSNIGIGVRIPSEIADALDPPGRYRTVGPIVQLTGIWKYHDPDRQGETYLEVTDLTILERGRPLSESPEWSIYLAGFVLLAIAALVMWQYTRKRDAVG